MHTLYYTQKIPLSIDECWEFFSSPKNLKAITPKHLGFKILNDKDISTMYAGQIIHYKIKPFWCLSVKWVTEITHIQKGVYFIDEQRIGPYKLWHHEHHFEPIPNGVLMHDIVYYQLFFGSIGRAINSFWVKKAVESIFEFRKEKLKEIFGIYSQTGESFSQLN